MATLMELRKTLEDRQAKVTAVIQAAGEDTDLDAVSPDLLPGETSLEKAQSLGRLQQEIDNTKQEIATLERVRSAQLAQTVIDPSKASGDGEKAIVSKQFGADGLWPVMAAKDYAKALVTEPEEVFNYLLKANPNMVDRRRAKMAIDGNPKAIFSSTIPFRADDAVVAPLERPLGVLDYINTFTTGMDLFTFHRFTYGAAPSTGPEPRTRIQPRARGTAGRELSQAETIHRVVLQTFLATQPIAIEALQDAPIIGQMSQQMANYDMRLALESAAMWDNNAVPPQADGAIPSTFTFEGIRGGAVSIPTAAAGAAGTNFHRTLVNKITELREAGAPPTAIFTGATEWGNIFNALMRAGSIAGSLGIADLRPGASGLSVIGVPLVLTSTLENHTVVYNPMAYGIAMRTGMMIDISDEAGFTEYELVMRMSFRAAGAVLNPNAGYIYSASNVPTGGYS